jgi:cytochrome c-type biogenesis protein CcmH/NrfF
VIKMISEPPGRQERQGRIVGARHAVPLRKPFGYFAHPLVSWRTWRLGGLILFLVLFALPVFAQEAMDDGEVTADEVNAVAQRLYCPVCPNERLDACQTQACASWREDIRRQLEEGQSEEQIVADFVARYGERAAGTPLDPTLRGLSLYTPYVIAVLALVLAVITFMRWRRRSTTAPAAPNSAAKAEDDPYRSMLEQDLKE